MINNLRKGDTVHLVSTTDPYIVGAETKIASIRQRYCELTGKPYLIYELQGGVIIDSRTGWPIGPTSNTFVLELHQEDRA